jgi:hypothetical protein
LRLFLQSFWAFPATFLHLLTSNRQNTETERYSVYHVFRNIKLDMNMKKLCIWAVAAALFFAPMGLSSCSMGSSASEMKGNLNFTQDDLTEKPFKAIDVDVIASVYYTQNNGDECSVRLDYSAIKDAEFVQKLKEMLKVVYRDGEVKIGLYGKLKVPAVCNSEKNRLKIYITSPDLVKIAQKGVGSFYAKSINSEIASQYADRTYVYDNSIDGVEAQLLFRMTEGKIFKEYVKEIPEWAIGIANKEE